MKNIKSFNSFKINESEKVIDNFIMYESQSIVPHLKSNNMTQKLYPSGYNPTDDFQNQLKNRISTVSELTKDIVYKKKKINKRKRSKKDT